MKQNMRQNKIVMMVSLVGILLLLAAPLFSTGEGEKAGAEEKQTLQLMGRLWARNPDWSPDTYIIKEFAKIMDANIELIIGDHTKLQTLIASGQVPDIIKAIMSPNEAKEFGTKGVLFPVDTMFDKMPNINEWRQKYPEYDAVQTAPDGHQYGFPRISTYPFFNRGVMISYKVKDLGIDPHKDIKTFDDLYNVLMMFKKKYPESYPWVTRKGLDDPALCVFGTDRSIYLNSEKAMYAYGPIEESYKLMVEFMAKCWDSGLMHPEWFSMDEDPWRELLTSGKAFFTVDAYFQATWYGGEPENPDTWWIPILAPKMNGVTTYASYMMPNVQDEHVWAVGAKTKYPEKVVKLIDYMYSEEGEILIRFGRPGETAEITADGWAIYKYPEGMNAEERTAWKWAQGFHQFRDSMDHPQWNQNPARKVQEGKSPKDQEFDNSIRNYYISNDALRPPQPVLSFTADEWDLIKQLKVDVDTLSKETIAHFIRGIKPLSEWNNYVNEMKKLGVEELVKTYETAYSRYIKSIQ